MKIIDEIVSIVLSIIAIVVIFVVALLLVSWDLITGGSNAKKAD